MKVKLKKDRSTDLGYKLLYDLDSTKEYLVLSVIKIGEKFKLYRIIDESEEDYESSSEIFEIIKER